MSRPTVTRNDNQEWTDADFARGRPVSELPTHIRAAYPRTRGPQKAPTKVPVSIRLSPQVTAYFKAGGPGWQGRIDEALCKMAGI